MAGCIKCGQGTKRLCREHELERLYGDEIDGEADGDEP